MKNGYDYDTITNTLTITKAFARKASQVGTKEYGIILQLRKDYPTLKVEMEEKTNSPKRYTFDKMEEFISEHRNAEDLLAQFEGIRKLSKFHSMPFMYVKKWFDKQFPYYKDFSFTTDEDGFIVAKSSEDKGKETASEGATSEQTSDDLKNQVAEGEQESISANTSDSSVAKVA